jgi:hypothetical protein
VISLVAAFFVANVTAGDSDLEIHCVSKRIDQNTKKASDGGANRTDEHWAYEISIENKTFKNLAGLEVRYAIFLTREKLGSKAADKPEQQKGSFTIDVLQPHEKKTFTTVAAELKKSNLVGNWIYTSGAKPNAQDALVGLALRVYQNGQVFAEFANPSNLLHEKWE